MNPLLSSVGSWIAEPDDESDERPRSPALGIARFAAHVAVVLAVFTAVEPLTVSSCRLPDVSLSSSSLIGACAALRPARVILAASLYVVALVAIPPLRRGWHRLDGGGTLRGFVTAITLALAWSGTAYAYNPWHDQTHAVDRVVVFGLAMLVFVRPAFVLPFLFAFSTVIWQFDSPNLGFGVMVAEFKPLANILALFGSALLVQSFFARRTLTGFVFLALCVVAANFWIPGLAKLRIDWITHGHVYFLLPNAYTHGWLAFLSPEQIASAGRLLASLDWPMRIMTLLVECSAILMFSSARFARVLLVLCTALLLAFFATLGYLFWKWMLLQIALLVLLFGRTDAAAVWRRQLFRPAGLTVSVLVIAGAQWWFAPAALGWLDTPLADTFRYEAVGRSGMTYDLSPGFFAPYESHIAMGMFVRAVTPSPMIVGPYGIASNRATAEALLDARTLQDVTRLENAMTLHDTTETDRAGADLDEFIERAVRASNRRVEAGRRRSILRFLRPPPFLWTFARGEDYTYREPLMEVRVYRVSSLFDGTRYEVIRKERLRTVRVEP